MNCRPLIVTMLAALTLAPRAAAGQPAVTVYNQNFGVVRERITLEVEPGVNRLSVTDISAHVEPDWPGGRFCSRACATARGSSYRTSSSSSAAKCARCSASARIRVISFVMAARTSLPGLFRIRISRARL